ncbi:MAG: glutamate 5-kinase [Saprospiraceae bacterium]|nr:glutamate 5-kinase [Saprospiraceae bacterium]
MKKKRILLKIGTSTLTRGTSFISRGKVEDIGRQIKALQDNYELVIVSSGAIAVAKQFVHLEGSGQEIKIKQALAAIGQPHLMRIFQDTFRELDLLTAQCLFSAMDFENSETRENVANTLNALLSNGYIPVINENDTVSTEEIQFGDNDKLAALTAKLLNVDLLVMATNTNGIYNKEGETIFEVRDIDSLRSVIRPAKSDQGTGGMSSKLIAASIAQEAGIETWLVYGGEEDFLVKALQSQSSFTKVNPI